MDAVAKAQYWLTVLKDVDSSMKHPDEFLEPIAKSLIATGFFVRDITVSDILWYCEASQ